MQHHIHIKNNQAGFTLVETLVVIFIFGILMVGTTLMLRGILITTRQQNLSQDSVDLARRAANRFTSELRNATYGVNGAAPINQAGDTQIIFFSTAPKNDGTISRVRYYITGTTLYEGITNPSGSPLNYNIATETSTTILNNLSLGGNPLFYYYDGTYSGTGSALSQQVNINSVKFIKMNLVVLKQVVQNSTATFTISAGAAIRNLKTNLGN